MSPTRQDIHELFDSERSKLYAVALRITGGHHEAEDAVQDTWLAALKAKGDFRGESLATTWIYRIAVRAAMAVRARRRRSGTSLEVELPAKEGGSPEQRESLQSLLVALDTLTSEHRCVLALSAVEGFTAEQIGSILGIPKGTVWSRLSLARKALIARWKNAGR